MVALIATESKPGTMHRTPQHSPEHQYQLGGSVWGLDPEFNSTLLRPQLTWESWGRPGMQCCGMTIVPVRQAFPWWNCVLMYADHERESVSAL